MKRILLVSMYAIACITMISCTNDTATANENKTTVIANVPGDPIPVPPTR